MTLTTVNSSSERSSAADQSLSSQHSDWNIDIEIKFDSDIYNMLVGVNSRRLRKAQSVFRNVKIDVEDRKIIKLRGNLIEANKCRLFFEKVIDLIKLILSLNGEQIFSFFNKN